MRDFGELSLSNRNRRNRYGLRAIGGEIDEFERGENERCFELQEPQFEWSGT